MDELVITLIREIGPIGIIALALLGVSRTLRPAIEGLTKSMNDAAEARREQAKTNEAVLTRWKESDNILESHSKAFADAMKGVTEEIHDLKITDSQRIKQNDVTAAQVTGAREDIRTLGVAFEAGKNDAVTKVNQAMDDKLKPIEATLQSIQRQVAEALALLHTFEARPVAPPVALVLRDTAPDVKPDEPKEDEAEDKSA